ncbi:MAG: hypothetical protein ACYC5X_01715 [Syntrophales bacterium]
MSKSIVTYRVPCAGVEDCDDAGSGDWAAGSSAVFSAGGSAGGTPDGDGTGCPTGRCAEAAGGVETGADRAGRGGTTPAGAAALPTAGCTVSIFAGASCLPPDFGAMGTGGRDGAVGTGCSSPAIRTAWTGAGERKMITKNATIMKVIPPTVGHCPRVSFDPELLRREPEGKRPAGLPEGRDNIICASGISFSAPP